MDGGLRGSLHPQGLSNRGAPASALEMCLRALAWAEARSYTGFEKFDALNSPWLRRLTAGHRLLRGGVTYLVSRAPFDVRPWLRVEQRPNPYGLALFASTYFNLARLLDDRAHLATGLALLDRLLRLSRRQHYAGHCWGYGHDWEMGKFFVPQYEPNTVVTVFAALAFLAAYRLTRSPDLLAIASSSTRFLRTDLNVTHCGPGLKSYSYTPFDRWTALNTNALIAGLFAAVFAETGEPALADETALLVNFLLDRQTGQGAWYHADPPQASHRKIDNYHMAFILQSLLRVHGATGETRVYGAYARGLEFYATRLFLRNGAPMFESHRVYPHDIVACAQGIVTFAQGARLDPLWLGQAERVTRWTVEHMYHPTGRFYYQRSRLFVRRYTLMCWCQAWAAYALSEYAIAQARAASALPAA